ncbi:MAG: ATP-binding protein [Pirellulaceae bacterium]
MTERKRLTLLTLIMSGVSLTVGGIAINQLYRVAMDEERDRLMESAQSQARLIEAIARFDAVQSRNFPGGSTAATISQIVDAHRNYEASGRTGEFTLARREGDHIVFLLNHRHFDLESPNPVPWDSELAEPMRRALSGKSGTMIGVDYRGEVVLAAHEPVAELALGIVAKIDLAEVRSPFVRAALVGLGAAVVVVFLGSVLFLYVSKPMITELETKAAELQRSNRELERSNRDLQDFAYVVSHDLRAPLVNIQGFSKELALSCERLRSVLAKKPASDVERGELSVLLDEEIPEALEFITTSSTRMDSLLSGVLQFSRVARAAQTIRQLDMNHMLSEIVPSLRCAIEQAGAAVRVDTLPPCRGDEIQINQVFTNLLDNALKYLDPVRPGAIRVSGEERSRKVVYRIEDNGVGIPAEHQDAIYELFHRLDVHRGTGEGVGLTIIRRILDRHGGNIWVESEPGKGSRFFVSLPNV